jgi:hypothetical protein
MSRTLRFLLFGAVLALVTCFVATPTQAASDFDPTLEAYDPVVWPGQTLHLLGETCTGPTALPGEDAAGVVSAWLSEPEGYDPLPGTLTPAYVAPDGTWHVEMVIPTGLPKNVWAQAICTHTTDGEPEVVRYTPVDHVKILPEAPAFEVSLTTAPIGRASPVRVAGAWCTTEGAVGWVVFDPEFTGTDGQYGYATFPVDEDGVWVGYTTLYAPTDPMVVNGVPVRVVATARCMLPTGWVFQYPQRYITLTPATQVMPAVQTPAYTG